MNIARRLALEGLIAKWRGHATEWVEEEYRLTREYGQDNMAMLLRGKAMAARKCADELEAVLKL